MTIQGNVIKGEGAAASCYGFPTANLYVEEELDMTFGTYVGHAKVEGIDKELPCVVCYGAGYDGKKIKFEVHMIDWSGDLYGKHIKVALDKMINGFMPFFGIEQTKKKIQNDIQMAKEALGLV